MDFREADRRYTELKQQYDNGNLSDEEFRTQLEESAVQDAEGRWWVKHRDTGAWYYQDGDTWVPGTPYREPGPGESGIIVQEAPGWWVPLGIASAIVGLLIPVIGILLPFVGIYLGYRARERGKITGGNAAIIIGIVCLLLKIISLVAAGY
jgi:hypothetical protein